MNISPVYAACIITLVPVLTDTICLVVPGVVNDPVAPFVKPAISVPSVVLKIQP